MDRARIESFLDRFVGYASGAMTVGLLAVADRSGLLTWLWENGSGSVESIATGADLEERYVIEILSGLAASGVVDYDAATKTFTLPPEHALFVADESSPYYMGGWFDLVPAVLAQIDGVADATINGGGVGFEEYGPDLIRGLDRGNAPSQRVFLVSRWLAAVPGLVAKLEKGARVADVGCGTGTAAIEIAVAFPGSQVTGYDLSPDSVSLARSRAEGLDNVAFEEYSADAIPIDPPNDLVTSFDVIHDLVDPLAGMTRIRESLAPDGQFLMMEPNLSSSLEDNLDDRGALMYGVSALHCMTQSLAGGGTGLGAAWGRERAAEFAAMAGFGRFEQIETITNKFSAFYLLAA
jgi:SAM-dependent methyltransferase